MIDALRKAYQMGLMDRLHLPCPLADGTRVRLIEMPNDPCPIEPGALGTVRGGNGDQIWMVWDDGRSLNLIVGVDKYEVVQ